MIQRLTMRWRAWPVAEIVAVLALAATLGGCAGPPTAPPPPRDLEYTQTTDAARAAWDRGAVEQALSLYRRAWQRARLMDDASDIADAAYNFAVCAAGEDQLELAGDALLEAQSESSRAGVGITDILLLRAQVAQRRGERPAAATLAREVLESRSPPATAAQRALAIVVLAGEAIDDADTDGAASMLLRADDDARDAAAAVRARIADAHGVLTQRQGRLLLAATFFDDAARLWREARLYRDMRASLAQAGEAYEQGRDLPAASDRYYRATRSALADRRTEKAREWGIAALRCATSCGDAQAIRQARALMAEMLPAASQPTGEAHGR